MQALERDTDLRHHDLKESSGVIHAVLFAGCEEARMQIHLCRHGRTNGNVFVTTNRNNAKSLQAVRLKLLKSTWCKDVAGPALVRCAMSARCVSNDLPHTSPFSTVSMQMNVGVEQGVVNVSFFGGQLGELSEKSRSCPPIIPSKWDVSGTSGEGTTKDEGGGIDAGARSTSSSETTPGRYSY
jgi:hypothetical protein